MALNKLVILESAVSELEAACLYYNNKISGLGFELEEEIATLLELIKDGPLLFPIKFGHIHEAVVKRFPFVINYEVSGKTIIVSAIFHVKQSPGKKIKRKRK
jgi:hypothetical protein